MEQAQGTVSGKLSVTAATLVVLAVTALLIPDSRIGDAVESWPSLLLPGIAAASSVTGIVLGHLARRAARRVGAEEDDIATVALVCHYLLLILLAAAFLFDPARDALSSLLEGLLG